MAETTEEYRNRINQLKTGIENEPYIKKMRENIAEGISKTGNRQADIEVRQDKLEDDFVVVQQDARSNTPSGAELAVAAGSYNTLGERLDAEEQKVNAQLEANVKQATTPDYYSGAVAVFVDDDGYNRFLSEFKPTLDAQEVKVTLAVITDRIDNRTDSMTTNDLLTLQEEGHEIVSHTADHLSAIYNNDSAADSDIEAGFYRSYKWLKDRGFNGYDTLVYPWGATSTPLRQKRLAKKYYNYGIASDGKFNESPVDNMYISRMNLTKKNEFNTVYKPFIDEGKAKNALMLFLTHSGDPEQIDAEFVNTSIEYLKSSNIPIMTFGEAIKIKGNALSAGEFTDPNSLHVGNNGEVKSSNIVNNVRYLQGISPDTHGKTLNTSIEEYENETITIFRLRDTYDTVAGLGGTVYVNRTNASGVYSHAIFVVGLTGQMFINNVDSLMNWRGWKEFGQIRSGTTSERPTGLKTVGQQYFDTQLKIPIYWDGTTWRKISDNTVV